MLGGGSGRNSGLGRLGGALLALWLSASSVAPLLLAAAPAMGCCKMRGHCCCRKSAADNQGPALSARPECPNACHGAVAAGSAPALSAGASSLSALVLLTGKVLRPSAARLARDTQVYLYQRPPPACS